MVSKSALKVNEGIEQPPKINSGLKENIINYKSKKLSAEDIVNGMLKGDRAILAKAITLIESTLPSHRTLSSEILKKIAPETGKSIRIGITGVPGAGKSTFIEAFGTFLTSMGNKVAILAIDPSSSRNKGSILGDKTRMEKLSIDPNAFIRPSPSGGSLGGVARKTYESVLLCEAAGYNVILVETVGVGQSETEVHSMVDFFLLLMIAGAGDELQGMKRGIIEMSDAIIVNKADGDNKMKAELSRAEYQNASHLYPPSNSGWITRTGTCSALTGDGIEDVWKIDGDFIKQTKNNGYFYENRNSQEVARFHRAIEEGLKNNFYNNESLMLKIKSLEMEIQGGLIDVYSSAENILNEYLKTK